MMLLLLRRPFIVGVRSGHSWRLCNRQQPRKGVGSRDRLEGIRSSYKTTHAYKFKDLLIFIYLMNKNFEADCSYIKGLVFGAVVRWRNGCWALVEWYRVRPKYSQENLLQCHFSKHISHIDCPGIEPMLRWEVVRSCSLCPLCYHPHTDGHNK
jgi:hypothetical protein